MMASHCPPSPILPCQNQRGPSGHGASLGAGQASGRTQPGGKAPRSPLGLPTPLTYLLPLRTSGLTLAVEVRDSWSEKDGRGAENQHQAHVLEEWFGC